MSDEHCEYCTPAGYIPHHTYCPNNPKHKIMSNEVSKPKPEDMQVALEAILARLQEIDETPASRGSFATSIIYGQMHGFDKPCFEDEVKVIRRGLNLKDEVLLPKPVSTELTPARNTENEFTLGDL